jgi:creatinine amidohydrolase
MGRASPTERVQYFELLPHEFRARLAARPIGYLPLGTLEWHGEQNALGADALQAQALFIRAARRFGGIVFPPLFLGPSSARRQPDGSMLYAMDFAASTTPPRQLDGSAYWVSWGLFLEMVEAALVQARRAGFQIVVADGHGPSRRAFREQAPAWESQLGLRLICPGSRLPGGARGETGHNIGAGWLSQVDHAGKNETSLMLAHHPELVDLGQLPADRAIWPQGVSGEDPRDATAAHGEACIATSLALLADALAAL